MVSTFVYNFIPLKSILVETGRKHDSNSFKGSGKAWVKKKVHNSYRTLYPCTVVQYLGNLQYYCTRVKCAVSVVHFSRPKTFRCIPYCIQDLVTVEDVELHHHQPLLLADTDMYVDNELHLSVALFYQRCFTLSTLLEDR